MNFLLIITFLLNFSSPDKCIDLILNLKISEAYIIYQSINTSDKSEEVQFILAYFNRNVDEALPIYEDLYLSTKNSKIKYLTTKKLYEYYYAKGLYVKAQNLKVSLGNSPVTPEAITTPILEKSYIIQCGVYGLESNALSMKEKIATIIQNEVYLIKDMINNQEVIRVYIGKINSYQSAENIKKMIDSKLSLNTMIKEIEE